MRLVLFLILITFSKVSFAATKWNLYSTGGFSEKIIYYTPIIDPKPKVVAKNNIKTYDVLPSQEHNLGFKFQYHCKQKRFVARVTGYTTVNGKFYSAQYRALNIQNDNSFEGLGLSQLKDGMNFVKFKSRIDGKMTNLYGDINNMNWIKGFKRKYQPKERIKSSVIEFSKKSSKKILKAKLVTFEVKTRKYGNLLVTFDAQNLPPCKR